MVIDERTDFVADIGAVAGLARQPRLEIGGLLFEHPFEQIAHALPVRWHHPGPAPLSSRNSQARASAQRRFTVAGDRPSASAVSSLVNPTK